MIASQSPSCLDIMTDAQVEILSVGADNPLNRINLFVNDFVPTPNMAYADFVFNDTVFGGAKTVAFSFTKDPQNDGSYDIFDGNVQDFTATGTFDPTTVYGYLLYNNALTGICVAVRFTTPQVITLDSQHVIFVPRFNFVAGEVREAQSI